jgi:hypothetical protein
MSNIQKLNDWVVAEKVNGLVHVNLFPRLPGDTKIDLETAAGGLLSALTGPWVDITNQVL